MDESFTDDPSIALSQVKVHLLCSHITANCMASLQNVNARIIIAWIPHDVAVKFWCMVSFKCLRYNYV